jgi:hypothetical protein
MNETQQHFMRLVYKHHYKEVPLSQLLIWMQTEYSSYGGHIHPLLWIVLEAMRLGTNVPVIVTSHHRPNSDTTHGEFPSLAADLRGRPSRNRRLLYLAAESLGVTRIGHYCTDDHLHVDIGNFENIAKWPDEVTWLGKCPK